VSHPSGSAITTKKIGTGAAGKFFAILSVSYSVFQDAGATFQEAWISSSVDGLSGAILPYLGPFTAPASGPNPPYISQLAIAAQMAVAADMYVAIVGANNISVTGTVTGLLCPSTVGTSAWRSDPATTFF